MKRVTAVGIGLVYFALLGGLGAADAFLLGDHIQLPAYATPQIGVVKQSAKPIEEIAASQQLTAKESNASATLLAKIAPANVPVQAVVLFKKDDRFGVLAWIETPRSKDYFSALKQSLTESFSAKLTNLKDETLSEPGKPIRNILSFSDPAISDEPLIFLRVRERLYELHVTTTNQKDVDGLVEALGE